MSTRARSPKIAVDAPVDAARPAVRLVTIDDTRAGQRIDNFLIATLKGVPKSHLYRLLRAGEVRVNKKRTDPTYRLAMGDVVRIPPVRLSEVATPSAAPAVHRGPVHERRGVVLNVLYEDEALVAVDKPSGMAVHGGSGIAFGVIETLRAQRPDAKFLELVHRLDRETSGVLLLAKKRSTLTALHAMLRGEVARRIEKHYLALVKGRWPDERRHLRGKLSNVVTGQGERRATVDEVDGKESHTVVVRKALFLDSSLLDCEIRTGRMHQIRVHLADVGFPILGDDKYGDFALNKRIAAAAELGLKRMFLHAHSLSLPHPVSGQPLSIVAPLPAALANCLHRLQCATV